MKNIIISILIMIKKINRNYIYEKELIKNIKIIVDYQIESFQVLFEDWKCIEMALTKDG